MAATGTICVSASKKILDHVLGKTSFTLPAACYISLCTNATPGDPTMATPGTWTELTLGAKGMARQQLVAGSWTAAAQATTAPSQSVTSAGLTFGPNTTTDWGTIYGWGMFDASSSGNMLAWGGFASSVTIYVGDSLTIASGQITITLN